MKNNIKKTLPDQDLPAFVRETRTKLGLTIEAIAELIGTTGRSYRRWESGESAPSGQGIAKLYQLREETPDIFNPKQPIITVTNLAEQQTNFLEQLTVLIGLFKQHKQQDPLIQEQHQQLAKSLQLAQPEQRSNYQQTNYQNTQQANQPSHQEMDKLFQLLKKLENRLAFLEDKCGYPYQPSQYSNDNNRRGYGKRNR